MIDHSNIGVTTTVNQKALWEKADINFIESFNLTTHIFRRLGRLFCLIHDYNEHRYDIPHNSIGTRSTDEI